MAKKETDARAQAAADAIAAEFGGGAVPEKDETPEKPPAEPPAETAAPQAPAKAADEVLTVDGLAGTMHLALLPTEKLKPGKGFRKTDTQDPAFLELVQSIKTNGVINPVSVVGNKVIAGRRRLEAAKTAGLKNIPAVEVEAKGSDQTLITFIDNVQRKNLNGIEEAKGLQMLLDKSIVKNRSELAKILGVTPSAITQKLAVLELPPKLKKAVTERKISATAATQLKGADTSVVDQLLADGEAAAKKVTAKQAKAAVSGGASVTVPPVEGAPDDIRSVKLDAKGVTLKIFVAHPSKKWSKGELGKALREIAKLVPDSIDGALASARKELG